MDYSLTIIVPVYNEEENLLRVEEKLKEYALKTNFDCQILLVNDGSKDNSEKLMVEICDRNPEFNYISFEKNCGLSAAIKAGFDYSTTNLTGYIDSDLQTDPFDFDLLMNEIDNYDLVNGFRHERKDSGIKNLSSLVANTVRNWFTHDGMDDTGCPLKIIRTDYAKRIPMFRGLHRFLPAMILLQGGRIKQVPIKHFPRMAGTPKFGLRNRLIKPLMDCFAYLWMKKNYINYNVSRRS
ncbi:glycosyl transferase family 2 [Christiangramia gaetbulicola]|uniref:Glycosyl transferase family 2 n=1 Tax=Christiangramia gaetbulicola TaxID=703340 RepID=A0A2T6AGR8_9FLAO|nr:glycosyltransferase [Christiangramia gaetbulicola]PTX42987.1 glycosyl transferase family 2 [Christiangramia gaetbulicola]